MRLQYLKMHASNPLLPAYVLVLLLALALSGQAYAAVNVNTANEKQLTALPNIGKVKAKAIIEYREKHGPFTSMKQLGKVKGVGKKTLEKLKGKVTFGKTADAPATDTDKLNLNTASVKDLQKLPGIGKAKAKAIIKAREEQGGFASLNDLTKVKGINAGTLQRLRPLVTLSE